MAKSRKRKATWTPLLNKRTSKPPAPRGRAKPAAKSVGRKRPARSGTRKSSGRAAGLARGLLAAATAARGKGRGKGRTKVEREPMSEESRERLREILALLLFGVTLFLLLACLSWGEGSNLCGPTGESLAGLLLGSVGFSAYLLVAIMGLWGGMLFARVPSDSFSLRLSGLMLCLVSFAALLSHVFAGVSGPFPAGGVVGEFINVQLIVGGGLGIVGTRITLVVLTLITFVLATDVAYYSSLVAGASWVKEKHAVHVAQKSAAAERAEKNVEIALSEEAVQKRSLWRRMIGDKSKQSERERADADAIDAALVGKRRDEALEAFEAVKDEPGVEVAEDDDAVEAMAGEVEALAEDLGIEDEEEEEYEDDDEYEDEDEEYEDEEEGEDEEEYEDEDEEYEDEEEEEDDAPPVVTTRDVPPLQLTFDDDNSDVSVGDVPAAYRFPSESLLDEQEEVDQEELDELLAEKTKVLTDTLKSFKVEGRVVEIQKGPVISMFEMELAPGIKVEKVRSLEDDLAIALRARSVRIVAPIPGKNTIGIEVPNPLREVVRLKPLLHSKEFTEGKFALPIFLGKNAAGQPMVVDLAKMPHLLVAGATGSGKSVALNTIITSFLYTRSPEQVKLILIDPKMVELSQFSNAPHLACPVVSDMKRAPVILDWAVNKMEERYKLLSGAGVRNIYSYNKLGVDGLRERFGDKVDAEDFPTFLPFIVMIVDELADLMMTSAKEVEASITRLAAKSRAVGIHIILATQRPSTNVITGLIKANLPTRIAFMVSSKIDSRVILDVNGAEQLLGQGDMLFLPPHSSHVMRGQCTFVSEEEVRDVMKDVKSEAGPAYERELVQRKDAGASTDPSEVDDLYDAAVRFIFQTQRGSASLLQRKFAIGYTRASRLIDLMAEEGVLGEYKGSQARELTLSLEDWIALNPDARAPDDDDYGA